MDTNKIIGFFFKVRNQLQLLHWQTGSYGRHKAYDKILDSFIDNTDTFMEVLQGKYGRVNVETPISVELYDISSEKLANFIAECIDFLQNELPAQLTEKDSDLVTIKDEMLIDLNKLRYLLSLN